MVNKTLVFIGMQESIYLPVNFGKGPYLWIFNRIKVLCRAWHFYMMVVPFVRIFGWKWGWYLTLFYWSLKWFKCRK